MKTALLAIASVLLTLLLAEGGVRMLPDATLGFQFRGGRFSWMKPYSIPPEEFQRRWQRHSAPVPPKPDGTTRVALIGDSYVWAVSVPDAETVGARLQHRLHEASREPFDVVAWGMGGWGPEEELAALRERGPEARPDWVVTLFLTLNDVANSSADLRSIHRRQEAELVSMRLLQGRFAAEEAPLFLVRGSRLNQLLSYRLALRIGARAREDVPIDYFVYGVDSDAVWQRAWARTEELLLETRRTALSLGARYAIVSASTPHGVLGAAEGLERLRAAYPGMRGIEWDLDAPDRRLAEFCARSGIPFLGLEPSFREATRAGGRFHWEVDGHWNPAGNDLAGRLIAEFLLRLEGASAPY